MRSWAENSKLHAEQMQLKTGRREKRGKVEEEQGLLRRWGVGARGYHLERTEKGHLRKRTLRALQKALVQK